MLQIPLTNAKFLSVEYPGRVKNIDRALETLGGEEALVTALENPKKSVELRLRPKDPFCHPIMSDMKNTPTILLKVTRRRKKNDPNDEGTIEAKAIGLVTRTCRFRGMSDFQYILPQESRMRQLRHSLEKGNVKNIIDFRAKDDEENPDDTDSIPPPMFSTRGTPFPYLYKQNLPVIRVRVRQRDGTYAVKTLQRHQKEGPMKLQIAFENPNVPTEPSMRMENIAPDELRVAKKVAELFKQRPAWTRNGLLSNLDEKEQKLLRPAMYVQCYTFTNGPWRDCYFPFGIDPRTDRRYAIYQILDSRRRPQYRRMLNDPEMEARRDPYRHTPKQDERDAKTRAEHERRRHIFDGKQYTVDATYFMLCDIVDPDFQTLIHSPQYSKQKCTRFSGYYYNCVYERLRSGVKKKAKQLQDEGVADPIPDADAGMMEAIANEKSKTKGEKDGEEYESGDDAEQLGLWGGTDDPEIAKMLKTLQQAGALGMDMEDFDQLEEYDLDEFGDEGQAGDEGEDDGNEDEPLWKLSDLGDL